MCSQQGRIARINPKVGSDGKQGQCNAQPRSESEVIRVRNQTLGELLRVFGKTTFPAHRRSGAGVVSIYRRRQNIPDVFAILRISMLFVGS